MHLKVQTSFNGDVGAIGILIGHLRVQSQRSGYLYDICGMKMHENLFEKCVCLKIVFVVSIASLNLKNDLDMIVTSI